MVNSSQFLWAQVSSLSNGAHGIPAAAFKLSVRPEEKFSSLGPVVKEGKKAVLLRLNSENSDLKQSIARINQ
jgi:hypothetical protein